MNSIQKKYKTGIIQNALVLIFNKKKSGIIKIHKIVMDLYPEFTQDFFLHKTKL